MTENVLVDANKVESHYEGPSDRLQGCRSRIRQALMDIMENVFTRTSNAMPTIMVQLVSPQCTEASPADTSQMPKR